MSTGQVQPPSRSRNKQQMGFGIEFLLENRFFAFLSNFGCTLIEERIIMYPVGESQSQSQFTVPDSPAAQLASLS